MKNGLTFFFSLTSSLVLAASAFAVDHQIDQKNNIVTENTIADNDGHIQLAQVTNDNQTGDGVDEQNSGSLPAFELSSSMIARSRGEMHDGSEVLKIDRPDNLEHPETEITRVYFELNEDDVGATGRAEIQAAGERILELYQSSNLIPEVYVEGHTDRTGSWKINYELARNRALTVKETLASAGVPFDWIHVSDHSEDKLSVPTSDGIREPRNRRVEITVIPRAR